MREVRSGIIKGLAITFLGILSLTLLGSVRTSTQSTAYASLEGTGNVGIVAAGIVLIGLITTAIYYFAQE